jgi:hypothetical protein
VLEEPMREGKISVLYEKDGLIYSLKYSGSKVYKGTVDRICIINVWPVGNEQSIV